MVLKMNASQVLEHIQINNMILAAAGDGVISGLGVSEKGTPDMSVDVATGSALINGTTYTESSIVNLVIEAAHATLHRKDLITYDPTTSNPVVTKGANHAGGTADPIYPPDIPAGDILLAIVEVAAAATTITNSEITDCTVEVVTGGSLDGLSNVIISAVTDNELLAWDTSSSKWINQTPAEAGLAALSGFTVTGAINMGDQQLSGVDDLRAYDSSGIKVLNSAGSEVFRFGATFKSFEASANADMNAYKINDLGNPEAAQDAATKAWVDAHNWAATDITAGILAVARGGTGVADDSYDADKVDGCDAGVASGNVFKIPSNPTGSIYHLISSVLTVLVPGTSGYQLTSNGAGSALTWNAASDLIFSDTHCPKCGQEFEDGDNLILHVIGHNEGGDILTIPMHLACANQPKKTVTLKRKVFEDRHILDELTGELVVQRVQKTTEKTVTRHRLKEGYVINSITGKAHTMDDKGKQGDLVHKRTDAIEVTEETIEEPVYEDVEYRL